MTRADARIDMRALLVLLEDDREVLDELLRLGLVELADEDAGLPVDQAELCRVARTLVRELEVNWPGVEIILRMRSELLATHRQMADLLELLAARREG